jgi:two-component system, sensor histidine kinase PdtaS
MSVLLEGFALKSMGQSAGEGVPQEAKTTIKELNIMGWDIMYQKPDSALSLGWKALALAKQAGWEKGAADTHRQIGVYHYLKGANDSALFHYDIALSINQSINEEEGIAATLQNKGVVYGQMGRNEEALELYKKALKINKKLEHLGRMASNYGSIGLIYRSYGNYPKALTYLNRSRELNAKAGDADGVIRQWGNMGLIYRSMGNHAEALKCYFQALKLSQITGKKQTEAANFSNIGVVYWEQGDLERAIDYMSRALAMDREAGREGEVAMKLGNIGVFLNDMGRPEEALKYYQEALEADTKMGNMDGMARHTSNIGNIYLKWAERAETTDERTQWLTEALEKHKASLELSRRLKNRPYIATDLSSVGSILNKLGRHKEAKTYLDEAFELAEEVGLFRESMNAHGKLAEIYASLRQTDKAYFHLSRHHALKDSLMNADKKQDLTRIEVQYEYELKALSDSLRFENVRLAKDLEIEEQRRAKQVFLTVAGGAGLALAILVVLLRRIVLANRTVNRQKNELEELLRDKDILMREINHRVKNNLQVVSSLLSIQGREIKDEKAKMAVTESRNRVAGIALIHKFLYGEDNVTSVNMRQYTTELCKSLFSTYKVDHDMVELKLDIDDISLDVDTAIPLGLILNELITNALKYAFPDGREGALTVAINETEGKLRVIVEDDGVGISGDLDNPESFGMKLLNAFKAKLAVDYKIESTNGTRVTYLIGKYKKA